MRRQLLSSNSDKFLSLFLRPLDTRYEIRFYSTFGIRRHIVYWELSYNNITGEAIIIADEKDKRR